MHLLVLFLTIASSIIPSIVSSSDYDGFITFQKTQNLGSELFDGGAIFFKESVYHLDNPVVINTDGDVILHGGNQMSTVLTPINPLLPMFIIKKAASIDISNVRLRGIPDRESV
jgi:hypothetical protein